MNQYSYDVTIKFTGTGLEAKNEKELRERIKEVYQEEFNIDLTDNEITNIRRVK